MNSRREFLKAMGLVGGGLILELSLSGCTTPLPHGNARGRQPNHQRVERKVARGTRNLLQL